MRLCVSAAPPVTASCRTVGFNGHGGPSFIRSGCPTTSRSGHELDSLTGELELLAPPPGYGTTPPNGDFNANTSVRLGRWAWTNAGWVWKGT